MTRFDIDGAVEHFRKQPPKNFEALNTTELRHDKSNRRSLQLPRTVKAIRILLRTSHDDRRRLGAVAHIL